MTDAPAAILLLAASRGAQDPLARHAGVANKCLIPVGGVPMIERVIDVLQAAYPGVAISVAIEDSGILKGLSRGQAADGLNFVSPADSPSRTVLAALNGRALGLPLLVTTADHALLTAEMVRHFWRSVPAGVDAAAAIASERTIQAAWPHTRRTYLRFRDASYSGCNLFAIRTPEAGRVLTFWQRAEERRKHPLAMIRLLGPRATIGFLSGSMTLASAVQQLAAKTGTKLSTVEMPFAEAAVDVDKPEDLALAQNVLQQRVDVRSTSMAMTR